MENLQIGTYGWQHNNWLGSFYPEDLPVDWQLDYFSNAFRVVLVPQSVWTGWSEVDLQAVNEAVEAPFYFYFAIESGSDFESALLPQLEKIIAVLKSQAMGVVVWSESLFTQSELAGLPVTLISTQHKLPGWHWQYQGVWLSGQPLAYLSELPKDPKAQVVILKDFMHSLTLEVNSKATTTVLESQGVCCIIGGEKIDMQQVANLKTIGEFLGF